MNRSDFRTPYPGLTGEESASVGRLISFLTAAHHLMKKTGIPIEDRFLDGALTRNDILMLLEKGTALRPHSEAMAFQQSEAENRHAFVDGINIISISLKALKKLLDA